MWSYEEFLEELVKAANKERKPGQPPFTKEDVERIHLDNMSECRQIYDDLEQNGYSVLGSFDIECAGKVLEKVSKYTC